MNRIISLFIGVILSFSVFSSEKYELCYNVTASCNNDCFYHLNNKYLLQYWGGVSTDKLEMSITDSSDSVNYKTVGFYNIDFKTTDSCSDFGRTLYMDKALSEVVYKQNEVSYKRELFSDFDNNRMVFHLESSEKRGISFVITASGGVDLEHLQLIESDGKVIHNADSFQIFGASDVTLGIKLDKSSNSVDSESYSQLKKKHSGDFEFQYNKCFFQLDKVSNRKDIERLFQYSRYVAVSSELSVSSHPQFFIPTNDSIFSNAIMPESYMNLRKFVDYSAYIKGKLVALSGDAINILPEMPNEWAEKGRLVGAQMPGGFVIDLVWRDDAIKTLVVRSNLGGNCRLKVQKEIHGCKCLGMEPASGDNPNPFYKNFEESDLGKELLKSYKIFDFDTYPGQVAVFSGSEW